MNGLGTKDASIFICLIEQQVCENTRFSRKDDSSYMHTGAAFQKMYLWVHILNPHFKPSDSSVFRKHPFQI